MKLIDTIKFVLEPQPTSANFRMAKYTTSNNILEVVNFAMLLTLGAIALLNFVCGGFLAIHGKKKLCHNV